MGLANVVAIDAEVWSDISSDKRHQEVDAMESEQSLESWARSLHALIAPPHQETNPLDLLSAALGQLCDATGARGASLSVWDDDSTQLVHALAIGTQPFARRPWAPVPESATVVYGVVERRNPVIINHTNSDERMAQQPLQPGAQLPRCLLVIPVALGERLFGVFELFDKRVGDFYSIRDQQLAVLTGHLLAGNLERMANGSNDL